MKNGNWIPIYLNLPGHPKFKKLRRELETNDLVLIGHLFFLWRWVLEYHEDGVIRKSNRDEIAEECRWEGESEMFVNALVSTGWLKENGDVFTIPSWNEYGGMLPIKRNGYKRKQQAWRDKKKLLLEGDVTVTPEIHNDDVTSLDNTSLHNTSLDLTSLHLKKTKAKKDDAVKHSKLLDEEKFLELYHASIVTKRGGKIEAGQTFDKTLPVIIREKKINLEQATEFLLRQLTAYTASPQVQTRIGIDESSIPRMPTWCNRGDWDQPPEAWNTPLKTSKTQYETRKSALPRREAEKGDL